MAPPPRPPIICYDLQTNSNARRIPDARHRVPLIGTVRKTKVTVVHRDASELKNARANSCWDQQNSYDDEYGHENSQNLPPYRFTRRPIERTRSHTLHDKIVRVSAPHRNKNPFEESRPYKFNAQPFGTNQSSSMPTTSKLNVANARQAYGQKLRHEAEERERRLERKRQHLAMQAQLDEITAQLESSKRIHENLLKTFGMSHNAARYIQQQDEDFAKLRKKVDQFAETRSKELGRRVQQMKRFQEIQKKEDRRVEERRLEETPISTNCKHRWNTTLNNSLSSNSSPTTNNATNSINTASPSSTISISSCSSPMSTDEPHVPNIHFNAPPTYKSTTRTPLPPTSSILSPSTNSRCRNDSRRISTTRPKDFSLYKGIPLEENETIEVTDVDFFEKVEDKTMLEVNELLNKMQSVLKDFGQELQ